MKGQRTPIRRHIDFSGKQRWTQERAGTLTVQSPTPAAPHPAVPGYGVFPLGCGDGRTH